jgi:UDP-N-acetylmuramoylalanine--D-glutamate ligase
MEQEHRMEHVALVGGVRWINDSKATNINSSWYALEATPGPIIWLAGGMSYPRTQYALEPYQSLLPLVRGKVKALYAFGEAAHIMVSAFSGVTIALPCADLRDAVISAHILAEEGDTVLLSPATASFDQYANMEQRGQHFKELVHLHCA